MLFHGFDEKFQGYPQPFQIPLLKVSWEVTSQWKYVKIKIIISIDLQGEEGFKVHCIYYLIKSFNFHSHPVSSFSSIIFFSQRRKSMHSDVE